MALASFSEAIVENKTSALGKRLDRKRRKSRVLLVRYLAENDEEEDDDTVAPFQVDVELDETIVQIKIKILEHMKQSVNERSLRDLKLIYKGKHLTKDETMLKTYYYEAMHAVNSKNFKWSYPYVGIMWISPHSVVPSNEAIDSYKTLSSNVLRRTQGEICEEYYGNIQTLAESQAKEVIDAALAN